MLNLLFKSYYSMKYIQLFFPMRIDPNPPKIWESNIDVYVILTLHTG